MGNTWRFYSPPYVILLIRTFVTLEGIAGQVDANFNIYEVALPWAIQRALSPSTDVGAAALRGTVLTEDNRLQWARLATRGAAGGRRWRPRPASGGDGGGGGGGGGGEAAADAPVPEAATRARA